ncbi:MAG: M1 family aminopeptidase [Bacteroidales bacterium]|nr:M1 family aminopeptidase [Bacteroidales bacterium]
MKKIITFIAALIIFPGIMFSQDFKNMSGAEYCSYKKTHNTSLVSLDERSPNSPKHSFDVLNYTLYLNLYSCYINPYPRTFSGTNTITFRVDTALNSIKLNAVNTSLQITSVSMAGTTYTHSSNILTINLDRTYSPGEIVQVKINYSHKSVSDGAFYVNTGFVFTDCEPEGARKWFPCWDKPSDKATFELTARVPKTVKLASNGKLVDSTKNVDTIYYHWKSRDPLATYLAIVTSKVNFNLDIVYWHKLSNPNDSVPMRFYYNTGENPKPMENIICPMATYYSETFCEHPFEKNGFATLNDDFSWGGMENQSLTSFCPDCWTEGLVAHEFAHQWFGDMITCGTWADIFLNEGFATFVTALWYGNVSGYTAYKNEIESKANSYLANNPGWAISNPSWAVTTPSSNTLFNYAITYCKGACVLHMLRYVMGDTAFFNSLKEYASDTVNFKYKSSVIPDFQDKIETVSGQQLQWFIDEWIYNPDHPVYQNTYWISHMPNNDWAVDFNAKQTQTGTVFFKMPIELRINFSDASDTVVKVMNDANNQFFAFYFKKVPTSVEFDPFNNIVLKEAALISGTKDKSSVYDYSLSQNKPNPSNNLTTIIYGIPENTNVKISIYNILGKEVRILVNENKFAGNYSVDFNCDELESGVYYYKMEANNFGATRKMIVVK